MRYGYRLMETGVQRVYEAQRRHENVTQATTLMNMKGFNLIQHACLNFKDYYLIFKTLILDGRKDESS